MSHILRIRLYLVVALSLVLLLLLGGQAASADTTSTNEGLMAMQSSSGPFIPTDQIIIKFKDAADLQGLQDSELSERMSQISIVAGVDLAYKRPMSGYAHVLKLSAPLPPKEVAAISARLSLQEGVEYAHPDLILQRTGDPIPQPPGINLAPNDPQFLNQWHYGYTPGTSEGLNLLPAWDITTGSVSTVVAVLDTGSLSHADLAGRTVPGYDMISDAAAARDGDGRDPNPADAGDWVANANECYPGSSPSNSSWHGTHVAGTIGAATNNGLGVAGVNWQTRIQAVRVLGKCGGSYSDIIDGVYWAAGLPVAGVPINPTPADVINMSLGGGGACFASMQSAVDAAVAAGTTVVVAAGNSNADASGFVPANCNNVITVASNDRTGDKAYYSNFGSVVEITAPGGETTISTDGVLSTLDGGTTTPANDNSYAYYQGTSMATPHVAGLASLILAVNPGATPAQIQTIIQGSARPFPAGSNCNTSICGAGIADAFNALSGGGGGGAVALISDVSELAAITSILDNMGLTYDLLNNNWNGVQGVYTSDPATLANYDVVVWYASGVGVGRLTTPEEQAALEAYLQAGGRLLVTGYDTLGSPTDPLMAALIRSSSSGDGPFTADFTITDGSHPITNGPFGSFPAGTPLMAGGVDHDSAEADTVQGAVTVAELADGHDKIMATELPGGGIVVYWNGNLNTVDWTGALLAFQESGPARQIDPADIPPEANYDGSAPIWYTPLALVPGLQESKTALASESVVFPATGDTIVVASGTNFWNAGDHAEGVRTLGLSSVSSVNYDMVIDSNLLAGTGHVDFDLSINGIVVGSFTVLPGETLKSVSYTFPPIGGPNYTIRLEETNTVDPGLGSIHLQLDVSQMTFSNTSTSPYFPATGDTIVVASAPNFWNAGDHAEGVRTPGMSSVNGVNYDMVIDSNLLAGTGHVDFNLSINGTVVGSFTVLPGETLKSVSYTFPPIAGPNYTIRLEETNTVDPGLGSIHLQLDVSPMTLSLGSTNDNVAMLQNTLHWLAFSLSPDGYEPDNSSAEASIISDGVAQTHNIYPVGDEDWVTFTLAQESGVVLETSGPSGDTRMWLYDSGLNELEFNDDGGASLWSRIDRVCGVDALPAGTYYVKVDEFGGNDPIADYDLSYMVTESLCPDGYEPDNSSAEASIISDGVVQTHNIAPVGDEDWVTFTLAQESGVVLETSGPSGDTRMWLYDSGLNELEFNDDAVGLWSRIDRVCGVDALPAGTYYVKVDEFGSDALIAEYDLSYTVTSVCAAATLRIAPPYDLVGEGQTVTVDVMVDGVTDMYGAALEIWFAPNVVEVVDADGGLPGIQITQGSCPAPDFVVQNSADNVLGVINYDVSSLAPSPPCNGTGVVASITFRGKTGMAGSISPVSFAAYLLADTSGLSIPATTQDGSLEVELSAGWIEGIVQMQGRAVHDGAVVCAWDAGIQVDCAITDATGYYSIALPQGTYDVTVEMGRYLDSQKGTVSVVAGLATTLSTVTLNGGDSNDDDIVNILDLSFMGARYLLNCGAPGWDDRADINNDCVVNIQDLAMSGGNYLKTSPVNWP